MTAMDLPPEPVEPAPWQYLLCGRSLPGILAVIAVSVLAVAVGVLGG